MCSCDGGIAFIKTIGYVDKVISIHVQLSVKFCNPRCAVRKCLDDFQCIDKLTFSFSYVNRNLSNRPVDAGDSPIFRRVISPNGFYSDQFLFRTVFIPKSRLFSPLI